MVKKEEHEVLHKVNLALSNLYILYNFLLYFFLFPSPCYRHFLLTLIISKKSYLLFYSKYYYHIFFIYRYYFIFQKIIKSIYYYIDFIIIKLYQAINYKCIQKSLLLKVQKLIYLPKTL